MTEKDNCRRATFHTTCLRRIIIKSSLRRRWRWLDPVLRMDPSAHARTTLTWTPEGGTKRGPKNNMEENGGIDWERATRLAQDRAIWRDFVEALCATGHYGIE